MISIREFRLSDLCESYLIMIKFVDFNYFNNEDVGGDSIQSINKVRKIFVISYKLESYT